MNSLADLWHYWGGDLVTSNIGDLQTVSGTLRGQQRVLRRLLTNPGDYFWHPDYGAGLPQYVGLSVDNAKLVALVTGQMLLEDAVAKTPAPQVTITRPATDPEALALSITYTDAPTGQPVVLSFTVSNNT